MGFIAHSLPYLILSKGGWWGKGKGNFLFSRVAAIPASPIIIIKGLE